MAYIVPMQFRNPSDRLLYPVPLPIMNPSIPILTHYNTHQYISIRVNPTRYTTPILTHYSMLPTCYQAPAGYQATRLPHAGGISCMNPIPCTHTWDTYVRQGIIISVIRLWDIHTYISIGYKPWPTPCRHCTPHTPLLETHWTPRHPRLYAIYGAYPGMG